MLTLLATQPSPAALSAGSLSGKYFVRHVEFSTDGNNNVTDARSLLGSMTFDGNGNYSFTGQQAVGTAAAAAYSVSGTYSLSPAGIVTLSNPQKNTLNINARFGSEALVGSSTEAVGNTFDMFVAIPAPAATLTAASVGATWTASDFELTGASTAQVRSSWVSLTLDGAGNIPALSLLGHAANYNTGTAVNQASTGATYSVNGDGTGTLTFPSIPGVPAAGTMLGTAGRTLYVSKSGNVILAAAPGGHDLFIAVRNVSGAAPALTTGQRFWNAGIRVDSAGSGYSYAGSSLVVASDSSWLRTRRLHESGNAAFNLTAAGLYTQAADGTGSVGPMKIAVGQGGSLVGATVGSPLDPTAYEIAFEVALPVLTGNGVFVNPQGIVNSASNAPAGDAIAPGEFITIYGSGLAGSTAQAPALPFPTSLGGVSVSINGSPAPIYFVSAGQINCIVPYSLSGSTATVSVTSGGSVSSSVTVPVAKTAPGVFTVDGSGTGDGAITHASGTLVNAASPATKGETVVMYVSGLGALTTPVNDGAGATAVDNASTPLAVYVAGVPVTSVAYQGLTVEAGLYQINFAIPSNLTVSGELPVAIQTPDAFNDTANIAVQ